MAQTLAAVARLVSNDEGQDLVEYGFVAALIALAVILAVSGFGDVLNRLWWGPIARAF
jgi:Flp pilus assembly pilin Flp